MIAWKKARDHTSIPSVKEIEMAKCICSETETLRRIEQDIASLLKVTIVNGNNDHITYSRDEFLQMLYNRPKETVRRSFSFVDGVTKLVTLVNLVILTYLALMK